MVACDRGLEKDGDPVGFGDPPAFPNDMPGEAVNVEKSEMIFREDGGDPGLAPK